ncbi:MAG TPA: Gfo/Idh/MocA family oxidoreductase [Candidatus Hydrogenedentes bacterium]|nr:Gfo/Idh/MocA family oxidoreductase [Candidatus Hydrogenedentota bacterium]HPG70165.1 Gfo/Idh/MocA family oxidoreductase [Candidatus Hydrogenedentota bacterium]
MSSIITRREFVRAGAALGMTAALGKIHAEGAATMETVRLGFVGVGSRGTNLLRTALEIPGVEVRAVDDIVEARAAQAQDIVAAASGQRPEAYTRGETDFERLVARDDLDAVVCATSWPWHAPVSVAAMRAGKYAATEVPAALTLDECWNLVRTHEETRVPCMMLENVCYFENVLALLRMVREGVFGEMIHAEGGYQHDCRFLMFTEDGQLTWRGDHSARLNGNLYPTHPIGPIAQWFNINRGDRFTRIVSMSTASHGLRNTAEAQFGPEHALSTREYALGDVNTCLIRTANGRTVTLYFDMCTPRPYDLILRLQGTKGIHMGWQSDQIYLEGVSPQAHTYEPFAPYMQRYAHPLWTALQEEAAKNGGHGGSDYITVYDFIKAVRTKTTPPQDVYDAATWSAVLPLSIQSVAQESATIDFPDFTSGQWETRPPLPIYGA